MKWLYFIVGGMIVLIAGYAANMTYIANPRVADELRNSPSGERAARVTLLVMPDGRELPVNYLREDDKVYIGVDGGWWRDFTDGGLEVDLLIKGVTYRAHGNVILDNQEYVDEIFARLRPAAPEWLPDWLNGKLIVFTLQSA
ncbi:MAG: hypothetical protein AAF513_08705 [Pseudomonadota bacterium]